MCEHRTVIRPVPGTDYGICDVCGQRVRLEVMPLGQPAEDDRTRR